MGLDLKVNNANNWFCLHQKTVCYAGAAVVCLANSRRVNHLAAGVFVELWHLFAGLRSLAGTHNDGVWCFIFYEI